MKTLLAHKQSEDQKRSNDYARYQFIVAVMNMDERMIIPLLKRDAKFLGNLSNWQLSYWFRKHFNKLGSLTGSELVEGISLDVYPGSEMLEFTFTSFEDDNSDVTDLFSNSEQKPSPPSVPLVLRFVLLFEAGKIADIRIPKRTASMDQMKKKQVEN